MTYPNLLDRWASQVRLRGHNPALVTPDRVWTYRELAGLAGGLRRDLAAAPDGAVLVACEDRALTTAAILACASLGRAFAPVDRGQPAARLAAMAEQLRPAVVLSDGAGPPAGAASVAGPSGIGPVHLTAETTAEGPWPASTGTAPDAGYVYFTSGTTGRPKGIAGSLAAVAHFVEWEIAEFGVGPHSRVSMLTSPGFDAFLRDALLPLCAGGSAHVPGEVPVGDGLLDWLEEQRISVLHCVPTLWRTMRAAAPGPDRLPQLRAVLLAGEAVRPSDVEWWHAGPGRRVPLINLYGPSETTMTKVFRRLTAEDAAGPVVPVGRPMPGVEVRVLVAGRPVVDQIGEVEIKTPFRLGGYLDGYTGGFAGPYRYRTGDLGRLRPGGDLEILGRRDQQVKVNGVRVELGEVEDVLRRHPAVTDVCAALVEEAGSDPLLCAYVVAGEVGEETLRSHAAAALPQAHRPALYVRLAALPRTLSGKVDRRRLPSPAAARAADRTHEPNAGLEAEIAAIWVELLGLPSVGRRDDFALLGGDSLRTARLLDRMRARFGVDVPLRVFVTDPTVAGLATAVAAAPGAAQHPPDGAGYPPGDTGRDATGRR
ncbi:non-ribosomal peptide synthetase [Dactylosporangium sp. NPDC048998]|uniref:non-ribosomal peptide synthetase n=1 Tax=Dactylosporangium sp. NPDC048998 TaxID=3363976 RepID=UPI0037245FB9